MSVWNDLVPEPAKSDLKRAEQVEWLLKYHKTFFTFSEACTLRRHTERQLSVDDF